jgi:hypothetical protein
MRGAGLEHARQLFFRMSSSAHDESRERSLTLLCALVILMPCGSIALIADAMVYPLLASLFLLLAVANPRPLTATTRALVYSLTIASIFAYIINLVAPINSERFFFPLIEYIFPFAICLAICLCFLQPSQVRLSLIVTLSALAMMIEGSCITNPHDSALGAYGPLWRNRFWIYGLFVIAQTIVLLPLLLRTQRFGLHRRTPPKPPKAKRFVYGYSLVLLACFAVASAQLTLHAERLLEPTFRRIFNFYLEMYRPRVVFGGEVDLNRKNSDFVSTHGNRILLRAVSEQAPGYLRGRAYETYSEGQWKGVERDLLLDATHDEDLASKRFSRGKAGEDSVTIDIHPARRFYSDVLLATGPAHTLELIADSVSTNRNGELLPKAWDRGGAYSLFMPRDDLGQAFGGPELAPDDERYLAMPTHLVLPLRAYSQAHFGSVTPDAQHVETVATHLQEACEYSLGVSLPGERDPVLEFLLDVRRGHCELYASTAVMLLRAQGIPARYVTGFACMERHSLQGCFVSRVADCHAWAEAWLADEQRWVLVEATPAAGLPEPTSRSSFFAGLFELPRTAWQKLYSSIKRGYFAVAVLGLFADFAHILAQLFWSGPWYIGWGGLLLVGLVCWRWWRWRNPPETALMRQFHSLLRDLERSLSKLGIARMPNATVAMRANSARELRTPQGERIANLLLRYESLRFRPEGPNAEDLRGLREEVAKV